MELSEKQQETLKALKKKQENGQTLTGLQAQKLEELEALKEQVAPETEETEVKPKVKRKRRKKAAKPEPVDPKQVANEANFFIDLMTQMRKMAGVEAPIPETAVVIFNSSYVMLVEKYGDQMAKWMPEAMFGASLFVIGYDTLKQMPKKPKPEPKEKEPDEDTKKMLKDIETLSKEGEEDYIPPGPPEETKEHAGFGQ